MSSRVERKRPYLPSSMQQARPSRSPISSVNMGRLKHLQPVLNGSKKKRKCLRSAASRISETAQDAETRYCW